MPDQKGCCTRVLVRAHAFESIATPLEEDANCGLLVVTTFKDSSNWRCRMKAENGLDKRRQAAAATEAAASKAKPAAKPAAADSKAGAKLPIRKPEALPTAGGFCSIPQCKSHSHLGSSEASALA